MKWLAVLLVLTNIGAYFWIQRQEAIEIDIDPNKYEGISLGQMSLKANESDQVEAQTIDDESVTRIDLTTKAPKELTFVAEVPQESDEAVLEPKRQPLPEVTVDSDSLEEFKLASTAASNASTESTAEVSDEIEPKDVQVVTEPPQQKATSDETEEAAVDTARICYRVGPYMSSGALENAITVMEVNAVTHTVPKVASEKQVKAVRVYLGPYESQDVVSEMRVKLKEKRVEHYVINSEHKPILQLGYFSGIKRGEIYKNRLEKAGFDVKLEKIYQEKSDGAWIYFELQSDAKLKELEELKLYRAASIEKRNCA